MANYEAKDMLHVHCFEPSLYTFDILSKKSSDWENVTLNRVALGNRQGEMNLYYPFSGTGYASLTKRDMDHFGLDFNISEKYINIQ